MLTAYNYYEPEEENRIRKDLKESPFFERELSLAERYSRSRPGGRAFRERCPMCGGGGIRPFYEKWGVRYVRCENCDSIFADVAEEDVRDFAGMEERRQLRLSAAYQYEAAGSRFQMWRETVDWLRFRTYRYFGRNRDLAVSDVGERWCGFRDMLLSSGLCASCRLSDSILETGGGLDKADGNADVVLAMDYMQQLYSPDGLLSLAKESLKDGGLLVMSMRLGTGLDTLLLKEKNRNVFPYEHVLLPSREGIQTMLEKNGFELLEFTTPGTFDVNFIKANLGGLPDDEEFIRHFLSHATPELEAELQRLVQRAGMSSHAQVVARRRP